MALNDYSRLAILYNGNPLTQITSIHHTTNSGLQRVDLMNEGLGGFTPGPGDCTIEVGFAIPISGTEAQFQEDCANGAFVTLQVPIGRKDYIGLGKIQNVSISGSTGGNVEGTFSWLGEIKALQG